MGIVQEPTESHPPLHSLDHTWIKYHIFTLTLFKSHRRKCLSPGLVSTPFTMHTISSLSKQSCPTPVAAPQELSAIPAVVLPEWVTTLAAGRLEWATTRAAALLGWAIILAGRRGTGSE